MPYAIILQLFKMLRYQMITIVELYERDLNSPLNIMKNIKKKKKTQNMISPLVSTYFQILLAMAQKIVFINLNVLKILP